MKKMIKIFFLLLCVTLCSCSLPVADRTLHLMEGEVKSEAASAQLLNIRIERWGKLQFSGLLALRQSTKEGREGLYYLLLDATGVKLLEVEVERDGSYQFLGSKGALKESRLAEFLSLALARIYLQQPTELPCSSNWLLRFCYQHKELPEGGGAWYKTAGLGPIKLWKVREERVDKEASRGGSRLSYHQLWLGVEIMLLEV